MQKPITYFLETPTIVEFCNACGSHAQHLNNTQKTCLIATLAAYAKTVICNYAEIDDIDSCVHNAFQVGFGADVDEWYSSFGHVLASLTWQELIKFIQALTSNI